MDCPRSKRPAGPGQAEASACLPDRQAVPERGTAKQGYDHEHKNGALHDFLLPDVIRDRG